MTQAIVMGVHRFLGFHIANHLLANGDSLIGMDWADDQVEDVEEKKSFFVRNSNYSFYDKQPITIEKEPILLVVNLYDFIMYREWEKQERKHVLDEIKSFVSKVSAKNVRVMLFVPTTADPSIKDEIDQCMEHMKSNANVQRIDVPELYGPWMSSVSPLQRVFSSRDIEFLSLNNAIYIEDFLSQWDSLMKIENEIVTIQKELQDDWQEDLQRFFQIEVQDTLIDEEIDKTNYHFKISTLTKLYQGLKNMERHKQQLDMIRFLSE